MTFLKSSFHPIQLYNVPLIGSLVFCESNSVDILFFYFLLAFIFFFLILNAFIRAYVKIRGNDTI